MADENGADERLVILLEARVKDFERRMQAAEKRGTDTYQKLQRGSKSATAQMEADMVRSSTRINQALATTSMKVGDFAKAFIGGFAGGAVLGALGMFTTKLNETVRGIAAIGDEARRAGMSTDAFQEWSFVANQNRISIGALTDGFKELSLRADEFIATGSGSAAESFKRLGYSAETLAEKMKDPSALMLEIFDRLQNFDKAAQIRIFDELLGGQGGEQFVQLLAQGEVGIQKTIDKARESGAVMDEEMIAKAAELDARWQQLTTTVGNWFKGFSVGVADAVAQIVGLRTELDQLLGDEGRARAILGNDGYEAMKANQDAVEENVDALRELDAAYSDLRETAYVTSLQLASAAEIADRLGNDALWDVLAGASNDMRNLAEQFTAGTITGKQLADGLVEINGKAQTALGGISGIDAIEFQSVISELGRLGGMLDSVAAQAWSLYDGVRAAAGLGPSGDPMAGGGGMEADARNRVFAPSDLAPTTSTRPKGRPMDLGTPDPAKSGSGRSGGGGSSSRIESLIADLQTEREITEKWYQESLDLLNSATEAQLEALGGKHEAIERLEKEHKERLAAIQETAQAGSLESMLGAGATMIGALSAVNKKALKISQAFAAAEAWVSTLKGAAKEIEKGTFGFATAALVLAKGAGFVTAIKGVNEGGGTRSTGGGSGATSSPATAPASPQNVILDFQSVDPALKALAKLLAEPMIAQLQKESKNGVNIVGARY